VVFPRPLEWVRKIANGPTGHRRGRLEMSFSEEIAYKTTLAHTLTKIGSEEGARVAQESVRLPHLAYVIDESIQGVGVRTPQPFACSSLGP
jgi:hypothetical protein